MNFCPQRQKQGKQMEPQKATCACYLLGLAYANQQLLPSVAVYTTAKSKGGKRGGNRDAELLCKSERENVGVCGQNKGCNEIKNKTQCGYFHLVFNNKRR
jgi:hypothetical protein